MAKVEEAIFFCANEKRPLNLSFVLGLHKMLLEGVPEEPGRPLRPGQLRTATDHLEVQDVAFLTDAASPAWRIRGDLIQLLEATNRGELSDRAMITAARFHYRFVRIHPFCDGNGRMARALSLYIVGCDNVTRLHLQKPINEVLWEHRDDYIAVLEYCDGLHARLEQASAPVEHKHLICESPFVHFFISAATYALAQEVSWTYELLSDVDKAELAASGEVPPPLPDLSLETIKAHYLEDTGDFWRRMDAG